MAFRFHERVYYLAVLAALKLGCLAVRLLPRPWLFQFADALGNAGFYLFRDFRKRSTANIAVALGSELAKPQIEDTVRGSLRNFFRAFVEIGIGLVGPADKVCAAIPVTGREHLEAALSKGKGVIALGAHLGNFFLAGARLAADGYPVHVLVNQPENGQFARLMDDYRAKVFQKTIHARPRRRALRQLGRVLRTNQIALIIADEYRREHGVHVPFFGRAVVARRGPATLALRTGAAVVPVYMARQPDGNLKLVIEPELELIRSGKGKGEIAENLVRMTQWLERTVRAYPDQWNWMTVHWQHGSRMLPGTGAEIAGATGLTATKRGFGEVR